MNGTSVMTCTCGHSRGHHRLTNDGYGKCSASDPTGDSRWPTWRQCHCERFEEKRPSEEHLSTYLVLSGWKRSGGMWVLSGEGPRYTPQQAKEAQLVSDAARLAYLFEYGDRLSLGQMILAVALPALRAALQDPAVQKRIADESDKDPALCRLLDVLGT